MGGNGKARSQLTPLKGRKDQGKTAARAITPMNMAKKTKPIFVIFDSWSSIPFETESCKSVLKASKAASFSEAVGCFFTSSSAMEEPVGTHGQSDHEDDGNCDCRHAIMTLNDA